MGISLIILKNLDDFVFSFDFNRYPALERLFNSFLIELVDSLNSLARPFRYPLLAALIKNLISILSLVLDVINEPNIILSNKSTYFQVKKVLINQKLLKNV